MSNLSKFWLLFAVIFAAIVVIRSKPDWSHDIVAVDVENKTPDKLFFDIVLTRPSRGVLAVGGLVDIRQDMPNSQFFRVDVFYSLTGSQFIRSPFHIPESNIETTMNRYYKQFLMESLLNCSDNAPRVDGIFKAPLTKRTMYLHDCMLSNEEMPSKMKSGYYKVIFHYTNFAESKFELLTKVYTD